MIYIFDKTQSIIKVLTNDDFTAAHLNFKINTATTFEFSLPASKALPSGSKYVATPHPLDDSKFIMLRLTERVDNTETIDYSAYELAYQELSTDGYIEDKRPQNQSALNLMKIALDGSNWELNNVNVSGAATTNFYYVDRLSAISKVVDLLGGEIVFYIEIQGNAISGRYMDYLARQGADTSKVFASGSNLLTVERQSDTSNIYTAILPRGKGEEIDNGDTNTPDGYGRRINISDVEWKKSAGNPLDKPKGSIVLSDPDATAEWGQINGNARLLLQTYDDIDDVNVLINSAYKTLQSVNHPQIQYSATVADVGGLSLGDTVLIMHGDRDLSYKTRVFEVKYDLLSPDQTELSLGDDLSSNSITSQINSLNAVADTTSSQTQWTINQIGRPGTTYGATAPDSPKVGDIWFKYLADGGTEIYRWNGDIWELLASPTTADDIANAVDDAVSQAKAHTDEVKQGLSTDISTAKSQAASQASTAEANAKSAATSQFNQAQSALSAAKSDLTNSIASEASARNAAVAAANSQAQTYANQAKADAMSAAYSADGVIRTSISSSANSLSATITQNKSSADSGISTAQTTAQAAVDGLKFKVSQTDYNTKTGQLQTDLTSTTQTANQAKTDIVSIKQKDSDQDAKMNSIVSDANGTKQTVSDLQTTQGKQSGDISTLQQRADGFDATVTKINNTVNSFGQTNQLMNTEFTPDFQSWSADTGYELSSQVPTYDGSNVVHIKTANTGYDRLVQKIPVVPGQVMSFSTMMKFAPTSPDNSTVYWRYSINFYRASGGSSLAITYGKQNFQALDWTLQKSENIVVPADTAYVMINYYLRGAGEAWLSKPMLVFESTVGTYVQGNYNNNDALAKVKLTADQATLDLSTYKTDADGRISKAQTDITATAQQVATKVSQTDYDTKTGQLTTGVSKAQQTADAATTSLANYKQDTDGRITANTTDIEANANAIKQKVAQSDYDANNTKLTSRLTTVETTANGTATTVSNLQQTVNNLGQVNQLFNTEFTPDLQGWTLYADKGSNAPYASFVTYGSRGIGFNTLNADTNTFARLSQTILLPNTRRIADIMSLTWRVNTRRMDNYCHVWLIWQDANGVSLGQSTWGNWNDSTLNEYNVLKWENISIPIDAKQVDIRFETREGTNAYIFQPMVSFTNTIGTYVPGNYNNNAALAQVKITADGINNFVRDSSGNISSDFQTALSKTSIITGSTLASSIQTQTSSQIASALTDNNGKIISLINQDSSGVQIAGENITLDGDTTVTGDFYAKGGNFTNLNASNITVGTLNGNQVNITNLNASNIVSGTITGININASDILLYNDNSKIHGSYDWTDLDEAIFPRRYVGSWTLGKRRLDFSGDVTPSRSEDGGSYSAYTFYGLDTIKLRRLFSTGNINKSIDINSGNAEIYLRNRNNDNQDVNDNISVLTPGDLQLRGETSRMFLSTNKTLDARNITNTTVLSSGDKDDANAYVATYVLRAKRFFQPAGYDDGQYVWMYFNPNSDDSNYGLGLLQGDQIISSTWAYNRTYSFSPNLFVSSNGYIGRTTSASKYKLAITRYDELDRANKLLSIKPARWFDKSETEQYADELNGNDKYEEHLPVKPHFGLIAEDLVEAGLEEFVSYGSDGQVEGLEYDRVWTALIPLIKNMKERIEELERKVV
ncbi:phage tail spike protein [Leuconostoc falkenbergense]|uniref:phage tail spike protein n=1 Tax=Leuconostoc falkenbergense TaxID=2766470 RepID=UPI0024A9AE95|nr:phage tail spike protein [Leuconostoc falkenbergense]MDI6553089.1 phage tail spike protein [Leuconostoc falkenbergense]